MTNRNAWMPACPVSRTPNEFSKTAALRTAALALALAIGPASFSHAQTPKPAPAPARKPAAPAAPAPAPAPQQAAPPQAAPQQPGQQEQLQLIYSPWTKFCLKKEEANGTPVCFTGKDARIESGLLVASAVLIEPEGAPKKLFRITVPLGMALSYGTRVIIDQDQPLTAPFTFCVPAGCMADYEATPDMIAHMKKGKDVVIQAIKVNAQPISIPLPLAEFAKAYEGAPTDPKVFEAQQQKLQDELQKRAEEARKKLESQPGASATPPGKTQ